MKKFAFLFFLFSMTGPTSGTGYCNANAAGTRLMGGVSYATISVTEYY